MESETMESIIKFKFYKHLKCFKIKENIKKIIKEIIIKSKK
jgi:hypothetical protein